MLILLLGILIGILLSWLAQAAILTLCWRLVLRLGQSVAQHAATRQVQPRFTVPGGQVQ